MMNELQAVSLYDQQNPFDTPLAIEKSNYTAYIDGALCRLLDWRRPKAKSNRVHSLFRSFVQDVDYSCLGARAAINGGHYRFGLYEMMGSQASTAGLARDLRAFVAERPLMRTQYATFIAFFDDAERGSELEFENTLWRQLQELHNLDRQYYNYDCSVSANPNSPDFGFSFGGEAFFVVGMHPQASRVARRFSTKALAFNARSQFDALRAQGLYGRFQSRVRDREIALQGSLNPNLSEFGESSEARQYGGRPVDSSWQCPFNV
ncbi:MAG: YqcI/YcgG family protein [Candidatus Eremiobacteraeota bacterium]|nr:YqcI/YcgG family protein [Candidatus Eremiobacteraeota bacterium]